jgi:hypothetical protein
MGGVAYENDNQKMMDRDLKVLDMPTILRRMQYLLVSCRSAGYVANNTGRVVMR